MKNVKSAYILVVDDEPEISDLVREILEDEGYEVAVANNAEEARRARRLRRPDLILLDVWMPDTDGLNLLREWSEADGLPCPVVMISGHGTVETAVEATRLGAYDFLEKPLSLSRLLLVVQRALEAERLQREREFRTSLSARPHEPLGQSAVMIALREQIQRIAEHSAWVLMTGEAGCGKELFARYLHDCSERRAGPFITAGTAAITGDFAGSELFGSELGETIHYGLIEQANGGTLYLSEVADMDPAVQGRLLDALQKRAFLRIGGREPVQFDARIVAATHHDLLEEVQAGRFREDLYYLLDVVPLRIPPLREHSEDVPLLVDHYVEYFVQQENLPYRRFSADAIECLRHHDWGGNVRELINLVQRLLILGRGNEVGRDEVESALGLARPAIPQSAVISGFDFSLPLREVRKEFEKAYFRYHLEQTGGQIGEVAKRVGMERTHLYRKLKTLGLRS